MASNKRPTGNDFELPGVPLKQLHIAEAKPKHPPIKSQPLSSSKPQPIITTAIPPKQVVKPAFIGILPNSPLHSSASLEYPAPTTITTPSGIIPLTSPGHPLHIGQSTSATQLALSTLTSLSQRFPNANLIRPLMTHPLLSPSNQIIPVSSITSTPQMIPDAPPPPYSLSESVSDDFGCSSPSQFLHSPTSVQTGTGNFDELKGDKDRIQHGQTATSEDVKKLRLKLSAKRKLQMIDIKLQYENLLQEKFFLEGGGNMMDYQVWRKKPNILKEQYMKQHDLDSETPAFEDLLSPRYPTQTGEKMDTENILEQESPLDFETVPNKSGFAKPDIPEPLSLLPLSSKSTTLQPMTPISTATSPSRSLTLSSPRPILRSHSTLSVSEVSHEDIVMRARHEAEVMKAISELRKEGLWSSSRLPKVQEPQRIKSHWDYLLEEMQWLATDFANERRWKVNAAKKLCRTISRHHQEKEVIEQRAQKDELQRLRKIASTIAKEVKHFWDSIQKVVEHKQQAILDEKRRKAMDMHLNFIVDQTQKYSSWLTKGMATTPTTDPSLTTTASNETPDSDDLFCPSVDNVDDTDDEETINNEESLATEKGEIDYRSELQQLEKEGEMSLDELLASLPSELLEEHTKPESNEEGTSDEEEETHSMDTQDNKGHLSTRPTRKRTRDELSDEENVPTIPKKPTTTSTTTTTTTSSECDQDDDYIGSGSEDEECTIEEQEEHEKDVTADYNEMDELEKEGNMSIEELLKKYKSQKESTTPDTINDDDNKMEENSNNSSVMDEESDEPGLESLVSGKTVQEACQTEQGLTDVAAAAQQLQPKGTTLSTTVVKTTVPFLLKHCLREYQHIGLDWLVTMYEKHLNGILADEMGLGKTIQTIALLAHLACDKGNWGPHLIIVPTSVMLNWEFEFKKWCPGFKILTYFGSFKERKQKRVGWSKYNAFHVCITSYNIAVQDHRSFKQKKWKYLVLDEAQNIKNFKSQRWQTLLTFNSQHRLLLTGTPLQNNLMELWSLMHFLMPAVFSSHSDFKEWFSNPLTGMVEGSQDYNESIITRLHQVLRPFLLRRLKKEVEKQLPSKYEHLVLCRLSKRQRFLYEEYMARTKTKETLVTGNYMSVINVLMQLRKVCNHPDLFEPRPVVSPFHMLGISYTTASIILSPLSYDPFKHISFDYYNLCLGDYELTIDSFTAYRSRQLQAPRQSLIDTESFIRGETVAELTEDEEKDNNIDSLSNLPFLLSKEIDWTKSRRECLHDVNTLRCRRQPVYGKDLVQTIQGMTLPHNHTPLIDNSSQSHWMYSGYYNCYIKQLLPEDKRILYVTQPLNDLLCSREERSFKLENILKRFVLRVPMATSPPITFHVSHPDPSNFVRERNQREVLEEFVRERNQNFHSAETGMRLQFPETRLIQYDCGKLQTLGNLLRRLKTDGHRVLIFTQMARMLDVLEIFLNYHGYTYLRLDGATPIIKRQVLMDRFNMDPRVFCFILSTRSGGLGVNLTGADTVIFYDSDWNPTMDAQAQDRCHRIGQTRDVHIYRLICESTVEENILKKANQKRMLGNIAIDSGAFTTEFFKQSSLKELFSGSQNTLSGQVSSTAITRPTEEMSQRQLEELLQEAEEENDVTAAKMAKDEVAADLAEFDEQYSLQQQNNDNYDPNDPETSRIVLEFAALQEQLSGIEKYMMRFLETENAEMAAQQLKQTDDEIQQAKKDWEFSHLQQLREQEEKMAREEEEKEEAMCLTYDRPEMINKVIIEEETGEEMNVWLPPTPPTDDIPDYYIDYTLELSYDTTTVMTPDALLSAAIHCEDDFDVFGLYKPPHENFSEPMKNLKKAPTKLKREHMPIPQSLFWRRYTPDLLTTRIRKLSPQTKKDGPEWLSGEDWILIKGLTTTLEFPLSLNCTVPAQTPNWSILADLVSSYSKTKRSPLQCKDHLVGVVIPREEQISRAEETDSKKQKARDVPQMKKHKNRRDQKTRIMVLNDKCKEATKQFGSCFHWIYMSSEKRKMQNKQSSISNVTRTSMHIELLQKEYDVSLDTVRSPMFLAQNRAERLQSEIPRTHQLLSHQQAPPYTHLSQISRQLSANLKNTAGGVSLAGTSTWPNPQIATQRVHPTSIPISGSTTTTVTASGETPPLPPPTPVMPVTVKPIQSIQSAISSLPSIVGITTAATSVSTIVSTHSLTTPTVSSAISNAAAAAAAAAVAKTYSAGVDINKGILLNHRLTQQQLLLLRQTAIQHQQQLQKQQAAAAAAATLTTPSTQNIQLQRHQIITSTHAQPIQLTASTGQTTSTQQTLAKIQIPGIEQLRPTIALSNQRVQGALVRAAGLPARSMQTEEVLALLRQQQALRMAMQTQTAKLAQQHQQQQLSQTQQQTTTQTTGLSEAIAAAALAAAAVQQQQQQANKQQQLSKQQQQQPSIVTPAESVKTSEQLSLFEANQLKVELVERTQTPKQK